MSLNNLYIKKIKKKLKKKFKYKSIMQVPNINKIILSIGFSKIINNKKLINESIKDLSLISGQKPLLTKAKKSISDFKLRKNQIIGCKVTLRNKMMWDFLKRLIYISIPRIRDFRGFSIKSFDGNGNLSIGIKEITIFPEIINYNNNNKNRGLNININTTAKTNNESYFLLLALNFPFNFTSKKTL